MANLYDYILTIILFRIWPLLSTFISYLIILLIAILLC